MRVLGIDPGLEGGIALVNGSAISAHEIPTSGVDAKRRIDVATVIRMIRDWQPDHAFIERAQAMPQQGASSGFHYGRAVGALEAAIIACNVPMTIIEARAWKNFYKLSVGGRDAKARAKAKENARQLALQLYPAFADLFSLKKHHQRAEAVLIARYGSGQLQTGKDGS